MLLEQKSTFDKILHERCFFCSVVKFIPCLPSNLIKSMYLKLDYLLIEIFYYLNSLDITFFGFYYEYFVFETETVKLP